MAMALNFQMLIISVFVMCVGAAFYSGTIDALIFDTLKQNNSEDSYDKKISNINTISLITPAVCSVIGGFIYIINPTYPFFASAFGFVIGLIAALFLVEPKVDTIQFSARNFILQTKSGLKELFKTDEIKKQTALLLTVGFFVVITNEMLNGFLALEFGFSEKQQGLLWSFLFLISALAAQPTPYIRSKMKNVFSTIFVGLIIFLSLVISPFAGLIIGGVSLVIRVSFEGIFGSLASIIVNKNTQSEYRATTLSTFNLIKNIPYVLLAYLVGLASDYITAKTTAFYLGAILFGLMAILLLAFRGSKVRQDNS